MTQIICRAMTCLFWEQGACISEEIEYEPDVGCLTFQDLGDLEIEAEDGESLDWEADAEETLLDDDEEYWEEADDEDWEDEEPDL